MITVLKSEYVEIKLYLQLYLLEKTEEIEQCIHKHGRKPPKRMK